MLLEPANRLRSALEGRKLSRQLLADLEEQCAQALSSSDRAHVPGLYTTLFVITRICSSIEAKLEQSRGSIEYHRLAAEMLQPPLLDAIDAIAAGSETKRLIALDELISASIEFART